LDDRIRRKREIFDYYKKNLENIPGLSFMPEPAWVKSTRWLTVMLVDPEKFGIDCETMRLALEAENIESRPVWKPMHLQPVFSTSGLNNYGKKQYPARVIGGKTSEYLFGKGLCLPSGTAMTDADLDRTINAILRQHKRK
jgi:dTDP-4-amino-4,6-dideoxygalactose transaminase